MHDTALALGGAFLSLYAREGDPTVIDIGAFDVNGSLRSVCPNNAVYLGVDIEHGPGVDIIAKAGEPLPLRSEFADLVLSSSQMEHDPQFWATFLELCRLLKPGGFIYMNAPSNGAFHRYPIDVWRFLS